jgi:uncharacterized protein (UPF0333 family)
MNRNTKIVIGFLILAVIVLVGFLAYTLGAKTPASTENSSATNTPSPTAFQAPTAIPSTLPTATPVKQSVSAGGVLSFSAYSIETPSDWTSQREQGQDNDKLTLTKSGYKIAIYEAAFGGGGCLYPGDAPSEMAQTFSSFVEINSLNGSVFRRGETGTPGSWTVCQKNTIDGSFGSPTSFGAISITTPVPAASEVMAEIDQILASIKKK